MDLSFVTADADEILRYSVLSEAVNCPHKYYVRYVLKRKTVLEASYFLLGRIVHTAIENFYNASTLSDAVLLFNQAWTDAFDAESLGLFISYGEEHKRAVDETLAYGVSIGKEYKAPEMTAYWKKNFAAGLDELRKKIEAKAAEFENARMATTGLDMYLQARKCVENFVRLHEQHEKQYGRPDKRLCEHKIDPPIELLGVKMAGTLDRLDFYGDCLFLYDYKTGRYKRWTKTDVANSDQLCWYAYAARELFGALPTKIGIWDLYNNAIVDHELTKEDIDRFLLRMRGNLAFKRFVDDYIKAQGEDAVSWAKLLPVPAGLSMKAGCPCDLAYEADESIKCPYLKLMEA